MSFGADLPLPMGLPAEIGFLSRWRDVLLSGTPIRTVTAAYTAQRHDHTILVDATSAAVTVTLPPAELVKGKVLVVKKIDSSVNAVTIDGYSSETIDGATTMALSTQWNSTMIQSNATAWYVLARRA